MKSLMCGLCPDVIGSCAQLECGAIEPVDENGKSRPFYMRHFTLWETPCKHVLEGHTPTCELREGRFCDCDGDE